MRLALELVELVWLHMVRFTLKFLKQINKRQKKTLSKAVVLKGESLRGATGDPRKVFVLKHLKAKFLLDDIKICGLLYVGLEVLDMKKLDNRWSKGESH